MSSSLSRRGLLRSAAAGAAGFLSLQQAFQNRLYGQESIGFGPLMPDPQGVLDLPPGFKYRAISVTGDVMDDGYRVPGLHDGMAAFPGPNGRTILVRNHEMGVAAPGTAGSPYPDAQSFVQTNPGLVYDLGTAAPASGGTTNLVFDARTMQLERHFLSSTGMIRNCAGGLTSWNSWLTCEETGLTRGQQSGGSTLAEDHGWIFDVRATDQIGIQEPIPLKAMGRFSHEATAMHPATRIVYETEDRGDSAFYRFIPNTPGNLQAGRLQALRFKNAGLQDTSNTNGVQITVGTSYAVEWVDLTDVETSNLLPTTCASRRKARVAQYSRVVRAAGGATAPAISFRLAAAPQDSARSSSTPQARPKELRPKPRNRPRSSCSSNLQAIRSSPPRIISASRRSETLSSVKTAPVRSMSTVSLRMARCTRSRRIR
jgi:uncharacterized protein